VNSRAQGFALGCKLCSCHKARNKAIDEQYWGIQDREGKFLPCGKPRKAKDFSWRLPLAFLPARFNAGKAGPAKQD
jgi:hypothetical protein